MAKPIMPTPILENQDAELFLEDIRSATYDEKKDEFLKDCIRTFEKTKK